MDICANLYLYLDRIAWVLVSLPPGRKCIGAVRTKTVRCHCEFQCNGPGGCIFARIGSPEDYPASCRKPRVHAWLGGANTTMGSHCKPQRQSGTTVFFGVQHVDAVRSQRTYCPPKRVSSETTLGAPLIQPDELLNASETVSLIKPMLFLFLDQRVSSHGHL